LNASDFVFEYTRTEAEKVCLMNRLCKGAVDNRFEKFEVTDEGYWYGGRGRGYTDDQEIDLSDNDLYCFFIDGLIII